MKEAWRKVLWGKKRKESGVEEEEEEEEEKVFQHPIRDMKSLFFTQRSTIYDCLLSSLWTSRAGGKSMSNIRSCIGFPPLCLPRGWYSARPLPRAAPHPLMNSTTAAKGRHGLRYREIMLLGKVHYLSTIANLRETSGGGKCFCAWLGVCVCMYVRVCGVECVCVCVHAWQ